MEIQKDKIIFHAQKNHIIVNYLCIWIKYPPFGFYKSEISEFARMRHLYSKEGNLVNL